MKTIAINGVDSRLKAENDSRNLDLHKKVLKAGTLDIIPENERSDFLVWFQNFFNKKVERGGEGGVQGEVRR